MQKIFYFLVGLFGRSVQTIACYVTTESRSGGSFCAGCPKIFCKRVENLTRHTNSLFSGHACFMDTVAFMTHDVLLLNNN